MTISLILHEIILLLGLIVSITIFMSVFLYTRDGAKFRPGCSFLAYIIMCMSILTALRILTGIADGVSTYDFFELFWQGVMCIMILINKGNISFIINDYSDCNTSEDRCAKE